jgi:hypothetical protein
MILPLLQQAVVTIACDYPVGGTAEAGARIGAAVQVHVRFTNNVLYVTDCKDSECTANETKRYALHAEKLVPMYLPPSGAVSRAFRAFCAAHNEESSSLLC